MAAIDHVYKDAGLTEQFDSATDTLGAQALNGSSGDGVFYVGTPTTGNVIQAASDPGVDPIEVTPADAAGGSGVEASHIKLALSSAGLASAVGGAALSLGPTINGGAANAVAVHYRWTNSVGTGTYTEISLEITARVESTP